MSKQTPHKKGDIKYTTDGKKVVVVGAFNSTETIVQEIFVSLGEELPAGERFAVVTLHNAAVKSWKEQNLEDLEKRYAREQRSWSEALESQEKQCKETHTLLKERLKYAGAVLKNVGESSFHNLVMFLCGEITHVVRTRYGSPELLTWDEFNNLYERKLRLLSLYGKDDGTLSYALGDYHDGSGTQTHFEPYAAYDLAFASFKELLLAATINQDIVSKAEKHGIVLAPEKYQAYVEKESARLTSDAEDMEGKATGLRKKAAALNNLNRQSGSSGKGQRNKSKAPTRAISWGLLHWYLALA